MARRIKRSGLGLAVLRRGARVGTRLVSRRGQARRVGLVLALAIAALAGEATAKPAPPPPPPPRPPDAGAPRSDAGSEGALAFVLARGGSMRHARLEGDRLIARTAGGDVTGERVLSAVERAALRAAAREVVVDEYPPHRCRGEETFVAVTVDGRTNSGVVCAGSNRPEDARWGTLLDMLRRLLR